MKRIVTIIIGVLIIGCIAVFPWLLHEANTRRQYAAVGGEWLILAFPLLLLMYRKAIIEVAEIAADLMKVSRRRKPLRARTQREKASYYTRLTGTDAHK